MPKPYLRPSHRHDPCLGILVPRHCHTCSHVRCVHPFEFRLLALVRQGETVVRRVNIIVCDVIRGWSLTAGAGISVGEALSSRTCLPKFLRLSMGHCRQRVPEVRHSFQPCRRNDPRERFARSRASVMTDMEQMPEKTGCITTSRQQWMSPTLVRGIERGPTPLEHLRSTSHRRKGQLPNDHQLSEDDSLTGFWYAV